MFSCTTTESKKTDAKKAELSDFLGHWTLEIEGDYVGWLDVRQEEDYIDADLLWKWASVSPVANVYLQGNKLIVTRVGKFVRQTDENGNIIREHTPTFTLKVKREGENISGYFLEPKQNGLGVDSTAFKGFKLPEITSTPNLSSLSFGEPIVLFNGNNLDGWKLTNATQVNGFKALDGVMVNAPVQPENGEHISYGNLQTEQLFEDFNLKLEVNVPANSNSGIYLRGIYEVQVLDSYGKGLDSHFMGGVYSRITPSANAEKPAGEWQSFDITLCERHITVVLNGVTIIENKPVYGPTGGALHADVFAPGPIYLQGDHGEVKYRNIVLTPILK